MSQLQNCANWDWEIINGNANKDLAVRSYTEEEAGVTVGFSVAF